MYHERLKEIHESLSIEILVAGFSKEGESILFLLKSEEKIVFSMLIDSCTYNNENLALKLIKQTNLDFLDFLVWTHPHDDHSKGLCELMESDVYVQRILLSEGVRDYTKELKEESRKFKDIVDSIDKAKLSQKKLKQRAIYCVENYQVLDKRLNTRTAKDIPFRIKCFAPAMSVINNRRASENFIVDGEMEVNENDFCIGIIIEILDQIMIFTSDIQNVTINQLDGFELSLKNPPLFFKIPHHGSKHSGSVFRKINRALDEMGRLNLSEEIQLSNITSAIKGRVIDKRRRMISNSVTTRFSKKSLPVIHILNDYKSISNNLYKVTEFEESKYSYVHFVYKNIESGFFDECKPILVNFEIHEDGISCQCEDCKKINEKCQ